MPRTDASQRARLSKVSPGTEGSTGSEIAIDGAVKVGPVGISFDAEHPVARSLPAAADLAADRPGIRVEAIEANAVRRRRERATRRVSCRSFRGHRHLVAEATPLPASVDAEVAAGPVVGDHRHRPGLDGHVSRGSRTKSTHAQMAEAIAIPIRRPMGAPNAQNSKIPELPLSPAAVVRRQESALYNHPGAAFLEVVAHLQQIRPATRQQERPRPALSAENS